MEHADDMEIDVAGAAASSGASPASSVAASEVIAADGGSGVADSVVRPEALSGDGGVGGSTALEPPSSTVYRESTMNPPSAPLALLPFAMAPPEAPPALPPLASASTYVEHTASADAEAINVAKAAVERAEAYVRESKKGTTELATEAQAAALAAFKQHPPPSIIMVSESSAFQSIVDCSKEITADDRNDRDGFALRLRQLKTRLSRTAAAIDPSLDARFARDGRVVLDIRCRSTFRHVSCHAPMVLCDADRRRRPLR